MLDARVPVGLDVIGRSDAIICIESLLHVNELAKTTKQMVCNKVWIARVDQLGNSDLLPNHMICFF